MAKLVWTDARLAWDPADYDNLDKIWFWVEAGAGLSETSEIWTPDIELWNQKESIKTSFSNSFAAVDSDGRVFWSRPGHLNPVCKFRGLERFPFDKLSCVIELGSWSYSGRSANHRACPPSFSLSSDESTETRDEIYSSFRDWKMVRD